MDPHPVLLAVFEAYQVLSEHIVDAAKQLAIDDFVDYFQESAALGVVSSLLGVVIFSEKYDNILTEGVLDPLVGAVSGADEQRAIHDKLQGLSRAGLLAW